jgi:hypothetical protein
MGWGRRLFVITAPFLREAAIDSVRYQETGARALYFSQSPAMLNFPNVSQVTSLTLSFGRQPLVEARS